MCVAPVLAWLPCHKGLLMPLQQARSTDPAQRVSGHAQEGEALTAEFRLGTYDPDASDLDRVHHDTAAAPADAKYVSQARARASCRVC